MICGVEDLICVCKEKIVLVLYMLLVDGCFLWEEVECLGVCINVFMVQIGKDFYEDLIVQKLVELIDSFVVGGVLVLGLQNGCFLVEVLGGLIVLVDLKGMDEQYNGSVGLVVCLNDMIKCIDGIEVLIMMFWLGKQDVIGMVKDGING